MPKPTNPKDEALLKEIRERYAYALDRWREPREEGQQDMRYLAGDPWEEEDRKARSEAGRPCINHDELNQYVHQVVNNVRLNKRGVKVEPAGSGTDERTAELEANLIRTAEYRSQAQAAYLTAFENAVSRGYGFFRISRRYKKGRTFEQEISVRAIENPDSVLYDPDCKEPDWSDPRFVFVLEPMLREDFKREYPDAAIKDFGSEEMRVAPQWIREKDVLVAEYWRVEPERTTLYLLPSGDIVEELPEGVEPVRKRTYERRKVVQYITNGVEILERNEQPDDFIPIVMVPGKKIWLDDGSGPKWQLMSLVRLARDPQMSLAYLVSQQMEEAGMSPKVPYIGYTGQFETDAEAWETAHKVPHAYLQVDPVLDATGNTVLPLPQRVQFTPNFAQYEVAKDSARRAIQAAMGITPLPTAAQRANEKSGVALQRIQAQFETGSFHFVDNYDRAIAYAGRIMEAYLHVTYDTEREEALTRPDGRKEIVRLNAAPETTIPEAEHEVTVSTGPSADSQRQEASDFLDLMVRNLSTLPVAPPQAAKLLALAIQMKQLGPLGDQMAEIISPDQQQPQLPPQIQQMLAAAQERLQALNAYAQEKEKEIAELKAKLDAKVVDNEYKLEIERLRGQTELAKAEITTQAQILAERLAVVERVLEQLQAQVYRPPIEAAPPAPPAAPAPEAPAQPVNEAAQPAAEPAAPTDSGITPPA